jgi:hypothetical protein
MHDFLHHARGPVNAAAGTHADDDLDIPYRLPRACLRHARSNRRAEHCK